MTPNLPQIGQPITPQPEGAFAGKDLQEAKSVLLESVRARAYELLSASDWHVVRSMDGGKPVPLAIKSARAAIRAASDQIEANIQAASSAAELDAIEWWGILSAAEEGLVSLYGKQTSKLEVPQPDPPKEPNNTGGPRT